MNDAKLDDNDIAVAYVTYRLREDLQSAHDRERFTAETGLRIELPEPEEMHQLDPPAVYQIDDNTQRIIFRYQKIEALIEGALDGANDVAGRFMVWAIVEDRANADSVERVARYLMIQAQLDASDDSVNYDESGERIVGWDEDADPVINAIVQRRNALQQTFDHYEWHLLRKCDDDEELQAEVLGYLAGGAA